MSKSLVLWLAGVLAAAFLGGAILALNGRHPAAVGAKLSNMEGQTARAALRAERLRAALPHTPSPSRVSAPRVAVPVVFLPACMMCHAATVSQELRSAYNLEVTPVLLLPLYPSDQDARSLASILRHKYKTPVVQLKVSKMAEPRL